MNWIEITKSALRGINSNKLRSALTLLGVLIGVGSVILLTGVGNGSKQEVADSISSLGSNVLTIRASGGSGTQVRTQELTMTVASKLEDSEEAPHIAEVVPELTSSETVSNSSTSSTATVIGTTSNYFDVTNSTVALGTSFSNYDIERDAKVVVIGATLAETLFDTTDVVGQTVTVDSVVYTINGVLAVKDSSTSDDPNSSIIMPISRMQQSISGYGSLSSIVIQATDSDSIDAAESEATSVLMSAFKLTDSSDLNFSVTSQTELLTTLSSTTSTLTAMLAAVASISLVVGGIGVTNIMLVTVTERTREIGIRKALGAKRNAILGQFLIEATVLSLFGGLLGVGVAYAASMFTILGVKPVILPSSVFLAVGVSVAIGVFFGSYPANRAAAMRPVDALRHD